MNTVFIDVDTQLDFLYPSGALYVPGAERIVPSLARLNQWASAHAIPLISTVDAHAENDPEFAQWPSHCIAGTLGQHKPCGTLVPGQHIIEKQQLDMFAAPALAPLLQQLAADRYVVYGVVAEICVRLAVEGLQRFGKPIEIVSDAVAALDANAARVMLDAFTARGVRMTTVAEVCRLRPESFETIRGCSGPAP